jgi:hypothetical protein
MSISEQGRKARFEQWEKIGVERVRQDLLNGGHFCVGGPKYVQDLAWEWLQMKQDAKAKSHEHQKEIVTLKPTLWGMSLDIKEAWRRIAGRGKTRR